MRHESRHAHGPAGYPIGRAAAIGSGTVYVALARLERAGWVTSTPENRSDDKPRRRFYRLTPGGRAQAISLLGLEWHDDDGTCKRPDCPNFGGIWRDCPRPMEGNP